MIRPTLLLALPLLLIGCGSPTTAENAANANKEGKFRVGMVFDSGGKGDKSFNDSAYSGLEKAKADMGIEFQTVDSKAMKDYEGNLATLAAKGFDVVFAIGITQKEALEKVAPRFPKVKFAIVDADIRAPNVRGLLFAEEEGSYLAGMAAGLATKTNKIGFVGGMSIPLIKKFEAGYFAGAKAANPNVVALPSKYTENWVDASTGKAAAQALFASGADVVFHASGRCGIGVIAAAKDAGKLAIGVDSDQDDAAPGNVLTSMVKRVDRAVYATIADAKKGAFTAGPKKYDLKDDGVGLTDFRHTKDRLPAGALEKIAAARKAIVEGTIKVPTQ
ncbi:MAG: BMP family ABC transporter substrate-binding protein [Armatimonadota bacterium]